MKNANPKKRKGQEGLEKKKGNALIFPWTPIDGVDMIGGDQFTSSQEMVYMKTKRKRLIAVWVFFFLSFYLRDNPSPTLLVPY